MEELIIDVNENGHAREFVFNTDEDGDPEIMITTTIGKGFEVCLGTPHTYQAAYKAKDARRLAWFILWTWWAKGTWFGLKRRLWYKALHRKVRKYTSLDTEKSSTEF